MMFQARMEGRHIQFVNFTIWFWANTAKTHAVLRRLKYTCFLFKLTQPLFAQSSRSFIQVKNNPNAKLFQIVLSFLGHSWDLTKMAMKSECALKKPAHQELPNQPPLDAPVQLKSYVYPMNCIPITTPIFTWLLFTRILNIIHTQITYK